MRFCRHWQTVILGGLISATILNMLVLPVLYLRFGAPQDIKRSDSEPGAEL